MNEHELFCNSIYEEQTHLAERELSAFIAAVMGLFGPEQARASTEDWLDESELMDGPRRSEARNWRAVTVAAAARLANRVNPRLHSCAPHIYNLVIRYVTPIKIGDLRNEREVRVTLLDQSSWVPMEVPLTRLALADVLSGKQVPTAAAQTGDWQIQ